MPFTYQQILEWRRAHKDIVSQYNKKYKESIRITKRCPSCRKHLTFKKDYASYHPFIFCKHCGNRIKIGKTLSANPNGDNAHGIRLKVV
jgi:rRNA maturation endonuclease Nob1